LQVPYAFTCVAELAAHFVDIWGHSRAMNGCESLWDRIIFVP